ncbi:MAG: hypothetical protein KME17_22765 [Cyanosarcina radialis HA8281-LM2]|jgi:hypothetical protein|nr:hypothetical protein [Cyanosarcina radialis HA8281-LM2]
MPEKAIDKNPAGCLVLLVPTAFLIVLIFLAWPLLLAIVGSIALWGFWQNYEWEKLCDRVNPVFHELIVERQGAVTSLDLAMKANLSGETAQKYLDGKANEFAAQKQAFEDKGTVYYFLTVQSLGSLFDESEPPALQPDVATQSDTLQSNRLHQGAVPLLETESAEDSSPISSQPDKDSSPLPEVLEPSPWDEPPQTESLPLASSQPSEASHRPSTPKRLIQWQLAKRLDVSSSTVYRRRDDPDFAEWTRSRDPEGIAWRFSEKTKEFFPLET